MPWIKHGKIISIDGLVHVAAINAVPEAKRLKISQTLREISAELWKKELDVNLTAAHVVTQAVAPVMMKQGRFHCFSCFGSGGNSAQ